MTEQAPIDEPTFYGKPLRFNPKAHRYTWDGKSIPSVTGIIGTLAKPMLIDWAANCATDYLADHIMGNMLFDNYSVERRETIIAEARKAHTQKRDDAGDVGREVHAFAQWLIEAKLGEAPTLTSAAAERCAETLTDWYRETKPEPIACERRVMSLEHWYAGTCDFFGMIDGSLAVLDFKTGGKRIYREAWMQTAAYEMALREELNIHNDTIWRWVVHIDKDTGKVTPECKLNTSAHTSAWLHLVGLTAELKAFDKMEAA